MSKNSHYRQASDEQYGKREQTLLKSEQQHLYHIYWSLRRQLSWKKSLIVICKISGLFVNTLTVGHKYCLLNREYNTTNSDAVISKKIQIFSISLWIFEIYIKFWTFSKKDDPHTWWISEITDSEKHDNINV